MAPAVEHTRHKQPHSPGSSKPAQLEQTQTGAGCRRISSTIVVLSPGELTGPATLAAPQTLPLDPVEQPGEQKEAP